MKNCLFCLCFFLLHFYVWTRQMKFPLYSVFIHDTLFFCKNQIILAMARWSYFLRNLRFISSEIVLDISENLRLGFLNIYMTSQSFYHFLSLITFRNSQYWGHIVVVKLNILQIFMFENNFVKLRYMFTINFSFLLSKIWYEDVDVRLNFFFICSCVFKNVRRGVLTRLVLI